MSLTGSTLEGGLPTVPEIEVEAETPLAAGVDDLEAKVQQKYKRLEWLIPTLLCSVFLGLLISSSRQLSQTADEALHLYAGYRYLKCGDLIVSPEHPPLARMVAAAPLVPMNFAVNCGLLRGMPFEQIAKVQGFESLRWLYAQDWPVALTRARALVSVFSLGLCLLVWGCTRRMFGFSAAVIATLLLIFEPTVLSYGSLVMTDVPVACMLLLTVFAFYLWTTKRRFWFFLLTALAAGLTMLAKASGVIVLPTLGTLAITNAFAQASLDRQSQWKQAVRDLLAVALIGVLAVGVLWFGYGMRYASYPGAPDQPPRTPPASASEFVLSALDKHHLLPHAYLQGFAAALFLSHDGSTVTFAAGRVYEHAPWFSTPFTLLVRGTVGLLAVTLLSAFGLFSALRRWPREMLFVLVPAAVHLVVCLHASPNVQLRYLLPMFPFAMMAIAAGCVTLIQRGQWITYTVGLLIVLHAASSLHAYPNYLSYANEFWGGPAQAYKYAPWVDIGQAYPEARSYLKRHPTEDCWFIAFWQWDPGTYGVPCQFHLTHQIPSHVHGTIIVSSTFLTHVGIVEGEAAAAFKNATPKDALGGSALLVYEGDFDTSLNAAAAESRLATHDFSAGDSSAALEHGRRAVQLAPASPLVHANLCYMLAPTQRDAALKECYLAQNLILADPLRQEPSRRMYRESVERSITMLTSDRGITYIPEPK